MWDDLKKGNVEDLVGSEIRSTDMPQNVNMPKVILIVDDDQQVQALLRRLLFESGYTTIVAVNGRQGVELAKTRKPDLILMDILMPEMDGNIACHIIKTDSVTSEIPVVMLTAVDTEPGKVIAKEVSADGYVTKPFTRERLLAIVSQFLPTS